MAAEHARVSIGSFFQREFFDHRAHSGKRGETQGVFGVAGSAGSPALQALAAVDERDAGDCDGLHIHADDQQRYTLAA